MAQLRDHPGGFQDGVAERLQCAGRTPAGIAALLDLDQRLFALHRAMLRGDGLAAIAAMLGAGLEQAELGALSAVFRIAAGAGRPGPEPPTVGALAQELGIDPSRASRLAARLIELGHLQREVAQDDARKAVLVPSDRGRAVMARFRHLKWDRYIRIFADWPDEDIAAFGRLIGRYMDRARALPAADPTPHPDQSADGR